MTFSIVQIVSTLSFSIFIWVSVLCLNSGFWKNNQTRWMINASFNVPIPNHSLFFPRFLKGMMPAWVLCLRRTMVSRSCIISRTGEL